MRSWNGDTNLALGVLCTPSATASAFSDYTGFLNCGLYEDGRAVYQWVRRVEVMLVERLGQPTKPPHLVFAIAIGERRGYGSVAARNEDSATHHYGCC